MRIINYGLFLLCISICSTVYASPKKISEYKLPNGLKLFVKVDNRAPVVLSQVWYKVGSRHEPLGITGISHFLEHMMFRGTKKYPQGQIKKIIVDNGGQINASTTNDYTMYYEQMQADKLPLIFEIESDRMHGLLIDDNAFTKEKQVILEERNMRVDDNPQAKTEERFFAAAYLSSPYHNMTIGWKHDIQNLTADDLRKWYKMWYTPDNALLIVVGDVDPNKVYRLALKYFGPIKSKSIHKLKPQKEVEPLGQRNLEVNIPAKLPWVILGYNVPSLKTCKNSGDAYALEVIAAILNADDSSRFTKQLIRGSEVAVNAAADYSLYSRLDNLFILSGTPNQNLGPETLKNALLNQIELLKIFLVSNDELTRTKTQLISSNIYHRDTLDFQAEEIGSMETSDIPWTARLQYEKNIQAVTAKQIRDVARKYLTKERLTVAILKPIQGK